MSKIIDTTIYRVELDTGKRFQKETLYFTTPPTAEALVAAVTSKLAEAELARAEYDNSMDEDDEEYETEQLDSTVSRYVALRDILSQCPVTYFGAHYGKPVHVEFAGMRVGTVCVTAIPALEQA